MSQQFEMFSGKEMGHKVLVGQIWHEPCGIKWKVVSTFSYDVGGRNRYGVAIVRLGDMQLRAIKERTLVRKYIYVEG